MFSTLALLFFSVISCKTTIGASESERQGTPNQVNQKGNDWIKLGKTKNPKKLFRTSSSSLCSFKEKRKEKDHHIPLSLSLESLIQPILLMSNGIWSKKKLWFFSLKPGQEFPKPFCLMGSVRVFKGVSALPYGANTKRKGDQRGSYGGRRTQHICVCVCVCVCVYVYAYGYGWLVAILHQIIKRASKGNFSTVSLLEMVHVKQTCVSKDFFTQNAIDQWSSASCHEVKQQWLTCWRHVTIYQMLW